MDYREGKVDCICDGAKVRRDAACVEGRIAHRTARRRRPRSGRAHHGSRCWWGGVAHFLERADAWTW